MVEEGKRGEIVIERGLAKGKEGAYFSVGRKGEKGKEFYDGEGAQKGEVLFLLRRKRMRTREAYFPDMEKRVLLSGGKREHLFRCRKGEGSEAEPVPEDHCSPD